MSFPSELTTERLHLRQATVDDAAEIFRRYGQDAEVCRYVAWVPHRTVEDTIAYLHRRMADVQAEKSAGYLIFSRETDELLGDVGGWIAGARLTFGYCLARDAWGRGYATEAASTFVEAAFEDPKIWRVQAHCDLENRASAYVLEKIGLTLECVQRRYMVLPNLGDLPRDMYTYAKVRETAAQ